MKNIERRGFIFNRRQEMAHLNMFCYHYAVEPLTPLDKYPQYTFSIMCYNRVLTWHTFTNEPDYQNKFRLKIERLLKGITDHLNHSVGADKESLEESTIKVRTDLNEDTDLGTGEVISFISTIKDEEGRSRSFIDLKTCSNGLRFYNNRKEELLLLKRLVIILTECLESVNTALEP